MPPKPSTKNGQKPQFSAKSETFLLKKKKSESLKSNTSKKQNKTKTYYGKRK